MKMVEIKKSLIYNIFTHLILKIKKKSIWLITNYQKKILNYYLAIILKLSIFNLKFIISILH